MLRPARGAPLLMQPVKIALFALLLTTGTSALGNFAALDACEAALEDWLAGDDEPPFLLAEVCPELNEAALAHPLQHLLEPLDEPLTLPGARALLAVGDHYTFVERGAALDETPLRDIMEELAEPPRAPSWSERLWAWLESQWLDEETPLGSWARNIEIDNDFLDATLLVTVVLLVAAAVALVGWEIYLARRHSRRPQTETWNSPARRSAAALSLDDVRDAAPRAQLSLLLALVLARLEARGHLSRGAQLTHRQVARQAAASTALEAIREPLKAISAGAEHDRYGAAPIAAQAREVLLTQGEQLMQTLAESAPVRRRRR